MPGAPRSPERIAESANALRQRLCFRVHFGEQPDYVHPRVHPVVAGSTGSVKERSSQQPVSEPGKPLVTSQGIHLGIDVHHVQCGGILIDRAIEFFDRVIAASECLE